MREEVAGCGSENENRPLESGGEPIILSSNMQHGTCNGEPSSVLYIKTQTKMLSVTLVPVESPP
jgi:hypothetical protein